MQIKANIKQESKRNGNKKKHYMSISIIYVACLNSTALVKFPLLITVSNETKHAQ